LGGTQEGLDENIRSVKSSSHYAQNFLQAAFVGGILFLQVKDTEKKHPLSFCKSSHKFSQLYFQGIFPDQESACVPYNFTNNLVSPNKLYEESKNATTQ